MKLLQEQNSQIGEAWTFVYCAPRAKPWNLFDWKKWRWRPYVNCIIVNKLNLVKLPSASLCYFYFSTSVHKRIGLYSHSKFFNWFQSWGLWQLFEKPCCTAVICKNMKPCYYYPHFPPWNKQCGLIIILIDTLGEQTRHGCVTAAPKRWSGCGLNVFHAQFLLPSKSMKRPDEPTGFYTHEQRHVTSAAAATCWSIHAVVQVTLKCINYSQHIRHDWLHSLGPPLSS